MNEGHLEKKALYGFRTVLECAGFHKIEAMLASVSSLDGVNPFFPRQRRSMKFFARSHRKPGSGACLPEKSLLATALAVALVGGGAQRPAWAGTCTEGSPGSYTCSGAAVPGEAGVSISKTTGNITVTTTPGFGVSVGRGTAISIDTMDSTSDVSFTDDNRSSITDSGGGQGISTMFNPSGSNSPPLATRKKTPIRLDTPPLGAGRIHRDRRHPHHRGEWGCEG